MLFFPPSRVELFFLCVWWCTFVYMRTHLCGHMLRPEVNIRGSPLFIVASYFVTASLSEAGQMQRSVCLHCCVRALLLCGYKGSELQSLRLCFTPRAVRAVNHRGGMHSRARSRFLLCITLLINKTAVLLERRRENWKWAASCLIYLFISFDVWTKKCSSLDNSCWNKETGKWAALRGKPVGPDQPRFTRSQGHGYISAEHGHH